MRNGTNGTKKQTFDAEVARAVGAGRAVAVETVDFNDPNRAKTCLEVDFPILPINQIAQIEGNAGKPIYQMSKWWARRRSSVFRAMLLAAAMKAPEDPAHAAKSVLDIYYANHQRKGALKHLKVADVFMGGGTTLVEGSRLGMQMFGVDLNPVAWFVTKEEFAKVDIDEVKRLLADIEAEVKPQIMPFYYCDGPNGEQGKWTHKSTGRLMGSDFDPLAIKPEERKDYRYDGPEIIYTFWAKHGPCQVTGCGYRTPVITTPVVAVKTLTVKHWPHVCSKCDTAFDVEDAPARMAPDVPFVLAPTERPFSVLDPKRGLVCPKCGSATLIKLSKSTNKKIELTLLIHPDWLAPVAKGDANGNLYGGSAQDEAISTALWNETRARQIRLVEVRGTLPETVTCPDTGVLIHTGKAGGTVPKQSTFTCGRCGNRQDVRETVKKSQKTGPLAAYAIQGYAPAAHEAGFAYNGRFFAPFSEPQALQYNAALLEWEARKNQDLANYWPKEELFHYDRGNDSKLYIQPDHGFTHWWMMFNPRQMLVHTQILKAILHSGDYSWPAREYILGAFQQYLRNQNLFCFWNPQRDTPEPLFSNNNYHPKSTVIENCVFSQLGRGNWQSCAEGIIEGRDWAVNPWEIVSVDFLKRISPAISLLSPGRSTKTFPGDPPESAEIHARSATDLSFWNDATFDLAITDPPFGSLIHYSDLADFFFYWLRIALVSRYSTEFSGTSTPRTLEVISNKGLREDPDQFYQRLLTSCWREVHRILKPSGILAFTFHHSEDEPWVAVLEALFDAGFYLEATYPIRSDESKGEGEFGSKKIEYDIIHVCRKRVEEPKPVSWARMRREVLDDVRQLQELLENHAKQGLPDADLQVIRRGKALEYFSRHYGKVYVDDDRTITVKDALLGINQLLDEGGNRGQEPPPVTAEPVTRQFLRIFDGAVIQPRDQVQKFLRGSGMTPEEFEQRGWCHEEQKTYHLVSPLELAREWVGRHRRNMTSDYDQAMYLIGACYDGSGINAGDTLNNENFRPHPALKSLLEWHAKRGARQDIRNAASRAVAIYQGWERTHQDQLKRQLSFFEDN